MTAVAHELSFARFLTNYRRDNPVGDLARDFRGDSNAPKTDAELLAHVRRRADRSVEDVVEEAWRAYRRARRKAGRR